MQSERETINNFFERRDKLPSLVESAIMVALATVLSLVEIPMPFGGGITLFSMVPIFLVSYRLGVRWGLATGFVYSIIQLIIGWSNVGYAAAAGSFGIAVCIILDYIVPFTLLGLTGVFKKKLPGIKGLMLGIALAVVLRFLCHFLSGGLIWYELTKVWSEGDSDAMVFKYSQWMYSFVYNITYMGPELVTSMIISPLVLVLASIKRTLR